MLKELQRKFSAGLQEVFANHGELTVFEPIEWLRDGGAHGGGVRLAHSGNGQLNRGSVNISQVHYEDDDARQLASANALSTIIHPRPALAPSMHMHISWTEMKCGHGYWRIMADLNPSNLIEEDREAFLQALKDCAGDHFHEGSHQGDKYFFIPALDRHRGVAHFYLEQYATDDEAEDFALARQLGETVIATYLQILDRRLSQPADEKQKQTQLDYHTLYLFQVLTLDRGTTSGLMVHNQNDVGIMGSLPAEVNGKLLASWAKKVPQPQDQLVNALVEILGNDERVAVGDEQKIQLAAAVRAHYKSHPDAIKLQASGNLLPPTVKNHSS
ncbi:coproporphyrinogen III oxidase [Persicirhabdus sediminis]|uniref:Coproporphyrinogen III oxidase n=1 Tax=Persicirhabdus sediminis TaxID=454144 RepID=A0A8J7SJQ8_9BACT|nr:coproporphyrinogen III oxidase [Persicirhabdus sediminis]MBK1791519.1 coproporphyrinogen III oxidase [Persicirhabdus sediminis]